MSDIDPRTTSDWRSHVGGFPNPFEAREADLVTDPTMRSLLDVHRTAVKSIPELWTALVAERLTQQIAQDYKRRQIKPLVRYWDADWNEILDDDQKRDRINRYLRTVGSPHLIGVQP